MQNIENPKEAPGSKKISFSAVPATVLAEVALGMAEGARKYGRHNYRTTKIVASTYYDATLRHLVDWWEGTDLDPASGLHHVTKAITSLIVLRDAMQREMVVDDRPPRSAEGWLDALNEKAADLIVKYPNGVAPFTEK